MKTISDIIVALGGNSAVARILPVSGPSSVSEMRRRGKIDVRYWPYLIAAAGDAELAAKDRRETFTLTNDILAEAHTRNQADAT